MEKEIPCLSNDMDSKEVISFYVLLKLINLLNVLRMMTSTWMGTSKLDFFLHYFLQNHTPMIWSVSACDGGSYRLCQVHMLGWGRH